MKIAITAHGKDRQSAVDPRFGRAEYVVTYDQEQDTWDYLPNTQNLEAAHGAGIQTSQSVLKTGAHALITGHVGPKAFKVLKAGKIALYSTGDDYDTVENALAAFLAGKLTALNIPNALDLKK